MFSAGTGCWNDVVTTSKQRHLDVLFLPSGQNLQTINLKEWVFVISALKLQCHIVKNKE